MKTAIYSLLFTFFSCTTIFSQTSLEGKVVDAKTGEPILFGTVTLYKNNVLVNGIETDLDGNYFFSDIEPSTYDVQASYIGYTPQKQINVVVKAGRTNRLDFALSEGVLMDAVEIVEYTVPLIEIDNTTSGFSVTAESIRTLPSKSINAIASTPAGISSTDGGAISIRGSRRDATVYYVDGVRVSGLIPHSEVEHLSTKEKRRDLSMSYSDKTVALDLPSIGGAPTKRDDLPKAGQMTAGEWNDLHNWKDWVDLLADDNYSIMMERFEIRPTERYSVIVVNKENAVISNVLVQLLDIEGGVIWETYTDNAGKAELWQNVFENDQRAASIKVGKQTKEDVIRIEDGSNTFVINEDCSSPDKMDIIFTVDATSSMNDEISYLKSELLDVIERIQTSNPEIDFNLGSVFYRDTKDEYLTRVSPLSNVIQETINFVGLQNSNGGGDHPEAVEAALEETLNLSWREDALKIVFLILDAPPHEDDDTMTKIRSQIQEAASKGIKLIPVTASGIGRETEFLMKFMAMLTNGTYVFITDDSGIGEAHLDPVVDDYEVEKLNDCLVRLITQYSKSYSCDTQIQPQNITVQIYPNPATQFINVKASSVPDKIKIYSSNGMMIKSITPTDKETRIELGDLVNGIYTISIQIGNEAESKQIILLK